MPKSTHVILGTLFAGTILGISAQQAKAVDYPIDCAILLCMAGGWPGVGDCIPARAEFIRRITPFPVEPPLQLWNCPMNAVPKNVSMSQVDQETIKKLVEGIKVWHVRAYSKFRMRDGECRTTENIQLGSYDANGEFAWRRTSSGAAPDWIITPAMREGCSANFRGVGLRWQDHEGTAGQQVVRY